MCDDQTTRSSSNRPSGFAESRIQRPLKRALDVIVSGAGIVVLWPVIMLSAVAVKMGSPGPTMFNSTRIGHDGVPFRMYRFRTMVANAEELLPGLQSRNRGGQFLIKIPDDPRITRVGRFLRRSSLDELPQLLNVLRGDMSLVGPRPQYPVEVEQYSPEQRRRLEMPPGITGLWQISARNSADFDEWVRFDLEYIDRWSVFLDLQILIRTVPAVLRGLR
jgi:lipopolysaccharide/colanic/teichoic acid biosynthesis glycosyltransferase